jgi:hypothetical protein
MKLRKMRYKRRMQSEISCESAGDRETGSTKDKNMTNKESKNIGKVTAPELAAGKLTALLQ